MVFISYAREDSDAARRLYNDLKKVGLNPWLDKESLIAGQNWKIAINKAIEKSRYFIPIFSSVSVAKRGHVQKEFKYALDVFDEFPESEIFVIPVRLDDCEVPYQKLKDIEYADLFPRWKNGIKRILLAMGRSSSPIVPVKKILWVDDKWKKTDKDGIENISNILESTGKISIKKETRTMAAADDLDSSKYDLVISNMELNRNDSGLNLLKQLLNRSQKLKAEYPPIFIFHERHVKEKYLKKAKKLKAAEIISKSCPQDLINRVAEQFGLEHLSKVTEESATQTVPKKTYKPVEWYNKGRSFSQLGKIDQAIQCYDKAIEIDPNYVDAWYEKGNALYGLESIQCYDKAIEIDPKYAKAWYGKGNTLLALSYVDAYANKGDALSMIGKYNEAIQCYDKAIEIDPKYAKAWYGKAHCLDQLGKYVYAKKCYDEAKLLGYYNHDTM
jgi:tetratricopeptide (TPR) repeat protein